MRKDADTVSAEEAAGMIQKDLCMCVLGGKSEKDVVGYYNLIRGGSRDLEEYGACFFVVG